ncbi:MAG: ComF family protein [Pseudomonadota bacterium]
MRWSTELKAGLAPIVDLVYPPRCPSCGVAVAAHGGLCLECWSELEETSQTSEVIAATRYNDMSRQLVLNFKHGGKIALARLLAQLMAARLPDVNRGEAPLLVPVPLHRMRLWERGYNQAALLAEELARLGRGELSVDALKRTKRTPSLGGLGKDERDAALKNAIAVSKSRRQKIAGRDILLVDDVYTSGATSSACAEVLLTVGAKSVRTICFARVDAG